MFKYKKMKCEPSFHSGSYQNTFQCHCISSLPKSNVLLKMYYQSMNLRPQYKTRVLASNSNFGSTAKMIQFALKYFLNFLSIFWQFVTYFRTYEKFGLTFFYFGMIWPILTLEMVKGVQEGLQYWSALAEKGLYYYKSQMQVQLLPLTFVCTQK